MAGSVSPRKKSILFNILYSARPSLSAVGSAINTHVRDGTIFFGELDAASRFVVSDRPRRYSKNDKEDILLGQNITRNLGALRLATIDVIRIVADRFGHFFRLGKSVGESLSALVGNERSWVFFDWISSAISHAFNRKSFSPVGDFDFAFYQRLVFPVYQK